MSVTTAPQALVIEGGNPLNGRIRQLVPDDVDEGRDLGVCLLRAGQAGRAINLLNDYLASAPDCEDADKVRKLVERAKCEVAKWN